MAGVGLGDRVGEDEDGFQGKALVMGWGCDSTWLGPGGNNGAVGCGRGVDVIGTVSWSGDTVGADRVAAVDDASMGTVAGAVVGARTGAGAGTGA